MKPIVIQGIPYDAKSSFMKGPALAPPLIRKAFKSEASNLFAENGIDISQHSIIDKGDFKIKKYLNIERITISQLKDNVRLLTLGGDHSITFPIIKAFSQFYSNIHILHIDAHPDLYHEFQGDPYSHACPFARIMEGQYAAQLTQLGIRTLNTHQMEQSEKYGVVMHRMDELNKSELHFPKTNQLVYISLDLDAIDPAFAPGVSHHEPGGLTSRQVIDLIHKIRSPVIGADIVEYNPKRDINDLTANLAAKLMKEILSKMIKNDLL